MPIVRGFKPFIWLDAGIASLLPKMGPITTLVYMALRFKACGFADGSLSEITGLAVDDIDRGLNRLARLELITRSGQNIHLRGSIPTDDNAEVDDDEYELPQPAFADSEDDRISKGESVWRRRMRLLRERDGELCHYCGYIPAEGHASIDHKIPQSKGGGDEMTNLLLACLSCNSWKGDRPYEWAIEHQQERRAVVTASIRVR